MEDNQKVYTKGEANFMIVLACLSMTAICSIYHLKQVSKLESEKVEYYIDGLDDGYKLGRVITKAISEVTEENK